MPSSARRLPLSPRMAAATTTAPTIVAMAPSTIRARGWRVECTASSVMATTGATLVARQHGYSAATTVTAAPSSVMRSRPAGETTRGPGGSAAPATRNNQRRPSASAMPATAPTAPDTRPMMPASATWLANTWRRDAPMARSSASSRVRCVSVMVKVLRMRKPPTNSAAAEKAARARVTNEK